MHNDEGETFLLSGKTTWILTAVFPMLLHRGDVLVDVDHQPDQPNCAHNAEEHVEVLKGDNWAKSSSILLDALNCSQGGFVLLTALDVFVTLAPSSLTKTSNE